MRLVMPPKITGRDLNCMSESVTEFSEVLPPYFPPPPLHLVGGCGGTDSGT